MSDILLLMFASSLSFAKYFSLIDDYLSKNPPPSEEEISALQDQFDSFSPSIDFSEEEEKRIFQDLTAISKTRPGYELIRLILEKQEIIFFEKGKPRCTNKTIFLDPFRRTSMAVVERHTKRFAVARGTSNIVLPHELIHLLHSLQRDACWETSNALLETSGELIDKAMDCEEEQHTITGLLILKNGLLHFDPINQNTIACALGYQSFRINHTSVSVEPDECKFVDLVSMRIFQGKSALENLEPKNYFTELNAMTEKNLRLLTWSFLHDQPLFKRMLKIDDVELNYRDGKGTLFELLLREEKWDFLFKLIRNSRFNTTEGDLKLIEEKLEASYDSCYHLRRAKALYLNKMGKSYQVDCDRLEQINENLAGSIKNQDYDGISILLDREVFPLFQIEQEEKKIDAKLKFFVEKMKEAASIIWNERISQLCEKILGFA